MDATLAATVAATDYVLVVQPGAPALATVAQLNTDPLAQIASLNAAISALSARIAILEARPEEVAHFTGSAVFPTAAIGATFTLRITGIVSSRSGDTLKTGEQVEVWPTGTVPAGLRMDAPSVAADGSVLVPCTASLTLSAGAVPVPFSIVALR